MRSFTASDSQTSSYKAFLHLSCHVLANQGAVFISYLQETIAYTCMTCRRHGLKDEKINLLCSLTISQHCPTAACPCNAVFLVSIEYQVRPAARDLSTNLNQVSNSDNNTINKYACDARWTPVSSSINSCRNIASTSWSVLPCDNMSSLRVDCNNFFFSKESLVSPSVDVRGPLCFPLAPGRSEA